MSEMAQVEILLAEDNSTDAELTMRALKKGGVVNHIVWVKDGAEAVDYLFRKGAYASVSAALPKLILLDLKMPKMDGLEVLRVLRQDEHLKTLPVVMLTSSAEESDTIRGYEIGLNSYIVKPVEFDKFVAEVSNIGLYWIVMNKIPHPR